MPPKDDHFKMIFWFVVGLCLFGAGFTVFLVMYLPAPVSARVAENGQTFWLTCAVSGGIGYLIGSSVQKVKDPSVIKDNTVNITDPDKVIVQDPIKNTE